MTGSGRPSYPRRPSAIRVNFNHAVSAVMTNDATDANNKSAYASLESSIARDNRLRGKFDRFRGLSNLADGRPRPKRYWSPSDRQSHLPAPSQRKAICRMLQEQIWSTECPERGEASEIRSERTSGRQYAA